MTVSQTPTHADPDSFIARWAPSGGQESANYQLFLTELCDLLGLDHPDPAIEETRENAYVFERRVEFDNGDGTRSSGWIDLYKRGCFVLEAKQSAKPQRQRLVARQGSRAAGTARRGGRGWDDAMRNAFGQARSYVHVLPPDEGSPPFLLVVDVAHVIDLYADFSGTGKAYSPFPDAQSNRIRLEDLRDPQTRETLRAVWQRPYDLDPTRESARVTKEVARRLADLARGLEKAGHGAEQTADFLMRCLFTLFAEDVELLPKDSVTQLLKGLRGEPHKFKPMVEDLWRAMNAGGFSVAIQEQVRQFNGTLFEQGHALPLDDDQLELMIQAAEANWRDVEPAIFGSLFEGALDKRQRHDLGAHFTPRAYVERLVMPTVIEPLREEWADAQTASATQRERGDHKQAVEEIRAFHRRLCRTRVLDPACGSGNFLYVTMEHMKRLEAEVLEALYELDPPQYRMEMEGYTVQPEQFLGIEINPRAASIARLVIWIGYLQWHLRTRSGAPGEPILRHAAQIEYRDAILAYDRTEIARDDAGNPITHWDGETYKTSPTTGEPIPDESARVEVLNYINPRPAEWPEADYVVGNPPFIAGQNFRTSLGDGYAEALWSAFPKMPGSSDFVMYWWHLAAAYAKDALVRRFGLITTNSIRQGGNREVVAGHLSDRKPISIIFCIPDHPWKDAGTSAAVRISMTVGEKGDFKGNIHRINRGSEKKGDEQITDFTIKTGKIISTLSIGVDIPSTVHLKSNESVCFDGVKLHGKNFQIPSDQIKTLDPTNKYMRANIIRPYKNGRDLVQKSRNMYVIDFFGLSEGAARQEAPELFQHVKDYVKPHRDNIKRETRKKYWWLFGENQPAMRASLSGLERYIATTDTSRHRIFTFLDPSVICDDKVVIICLEDSYFLGVLSSLIHISWSRAAGSWLGAGNDSVYAKLWCFDPFPFPDPSDDSLKQRIRELGEQLDRHRKERQAQHPGLTMTGMYNVLEKLRAGTPLTEKEKAIHEQGLVSVLRDIHDRLDAAVFDAYGWPRDLSDEQILERLVALNRERAAEEAKGHVRWLRPDFQAPEAARPKPKQESFEIAPAESAAAPAAQAAWPKDMATQVATLRRTLERQPGPVSARALARQFKHARQDRVRQILDSLVVLGHARQVDEDRYAA